MNDMLNLLAKRRSAPPPTMKGPGPTRTNRADAGSGGAGSRSRQARALALYRVRRRGATEPARSAPRFFTGEPGGGGERLLAERGRFSRAPLVVAVVSRAAPHVKFPVWEQEMSAGAACMALTVAAVALGFRTAWLTEWIAYDRAFLSRLGLAAHEKIAGSSTRPRRCAPIEDRTRPISPGIWSRGFSPGRIGGTGGYPWR